MKRRGWTMLAVSLITVALALAVLWSSDDATLGRTGPLALGAASMTADTAIPHFRSGLEALPSSLRGSQVDGVLRVDSAGHLRIDRQVRSVFDYFLSALGEEPLPVILARLHAYIHQQLPAMAAAEAIALLDQYVAYKQALAQLPTPQQTQGGQVDVSAMEQRLSMVQGLRRQYLPTQAVQAFFGEEDAYAAYSLARVRILQDASLSAAAKASELAAAEEQLPASLQASLRTADQVQNLQALTEQWRQAKGNAAQLRQIRENLVGAAAADRLDALDQQRAAFASRLQSYLQQRSSILANSNLSPDDRQSAVNNLLSNSFSAAERPRVQALQQDASALPAG